MDVSCVRFRPVFAALFAALVASRLSCGAHFAAPETARAQAPEPSTPPEPEAANQRGQRIYRGTYYRRGSPAAAAQLFWYERWSSAEASHVRSTHVHHTPSGRVVLRQSALHASNYRLLRFESDHRQTGVLAEARVLGPGRVRVQRTRGGELETVLLEHEHLLVVGPTLYGVMLRRWDELASGRPVIVDYLSIERLETYPFEIRRTASDAATTTFELAPSGFILSLLVSPLRVVFDNQRRQVSRYEGPSPVMLELGTELESFDTRIEYSDQAAPFR